MSPLGSPPLTRSWFSVWHSWFSHADAERRWIVKLNLPTHSYTGYLARGILVEIGSDLIYSCKALS